VATGVSLKFHGPCPTTGVMPPVQRNAGACAPRGDAPVRCVQLALYGSGASVWIYDVLRLAAGLHT
jgi:hypothetical protein